MNKKVFERAIEISWIVLVLCFIVKMAGGNWFATIVTSTWLETSVAGQIVLASLTSYILFSIYYMAICEVRNFKWWVHLSLFPYFVGVTCLKVFVVPTRLYVVLDLLSNFVIPAVLLMLINGFPKKRDAKKYFRIVVAFVADCGFQLISTLVKDAVVGVLIQSMVVQLVMTLDVFIMLTLYWLYSLYNKKKEEEKMGLFFTLLIGKGKEELEAMLAETEAKLKEDPENERLKEDKEAIEHALEAL